MFYEQEPSELERRFRILGPLLRIKDQYQSERLEKCFWLKDFYTKYERNSENSFVKFLQIQSSKSRQFVLYSLKFIGEIIEQDQQILDYFKSKYDRMDWIPKFC